MSSKKVIAIEASPHRGNTFRRVSEFGSLLSRKGDIVFEHIHIADLELEGCRGCFGCFLNGIENCPLKDDGAELLKRIRGADAVVFATPVYSMHVSWLMKKFVDRFAFIFHRPEFFCKYSVGLAVTGGMGLKETLKYISMFSGCWGFRCLDKLGFA